MGVTLEKEYAVLISIIDIGGEGTKKKVLDNIHKKNYLYFSKEDLMIKENRNEIRWRNDLAFTRKNLQSRNYIDGSKRNNWKITNEGIEYLVSLVKFLLENKSNIKRLTEISILRASKFYEDYTLKKIKELENDKRKINYSISKTEYQSFVRMRIGQDIFKEKLIKKEPFCKICGMDIESLLIASHIKSWSKSNVKERLDEDNGFLLCPNHDALFDKGYISFEESGKMIISRLLDKNNFSLLNISNNISIKLSVENLEYLIWHRKHIFKH